MFAKFSSWYLSKALELPSFHQWTLISLYFFDFLDFGLSWNDFGFLQLFLAFVQIFSIFWMFLDFVDFSHFWLFYWLVQLDVG